MHSHRTAGFPDAHHHVLRPDGALQAADGPTGLSREAFPAGSKIQRERVYKPIRDRYLSGEIFEKLHFILSGEDRRRVYRFIKPQNQRFRLSDKLEAAVEQLFGEEEDPDIPKDDYDEAMRQQSLPSAHSMQFGQPIAPHMGYSQPMYGQYPQMQPMYGQYPQMQPMHGMYGQPVYGHYPQMQPMHAQPVYGQPTYPQQAYPYASFGPTAPTVNAPPQNAYVPIKRENQHGGLGAKLSSNSNALLQSSQFSDPQEPAEPYDLLLPPPETKKATRAYKPIKPSNHPGVLSEKFSYNGQALLNSEHEAVIVASASPLQESHEERRLGYDGHAPADPNVFVQSDSHYLQRMNDPPPNPFEEAHKDYSAQKQQQEANFFQAAHEDHLKKDASKEEDAAEDRHRDKKEKKEKKEKRDKDKKEKKEKREKKRKSGHRLADQSSADASLEKREKKDRRDRTEDQDSDTHNASINKTADLRDKPVRAINLSPVQPDPAALEPLGEQPPQHSTLSHTDHRSLRDENQDNLAKSNLESSAEKKAQIRVVRRPKKKPEKEKELAGLNAQFPDTQTQEYHVRMRDRQAKLQEFLERKSQNHRAKLDQKKRREEERHAKQVGKPLWEAGSMHLDHSRVLRPDHTLSLMFEGKSYEQYYRDKYFEEVLGMHCPEEFRAEKQVPTVVRPAHAFKSPVGSRFRPLSLAQQAAGNGPEYLGPALTIQEPLIIKYHTRPPQNSQDWENETMDRYRYFNQDRKDVKFIRSSRKQTVQDALLLGATAPQPNPGFRESHSLKLPTLSKQKLNLATSRKQLIF